MSWGLCTQAYACSLYIRCRQCLSAVSPSALFVLQLMPAAGSASGRSTPRGGGSGASGKPPAPPQRSAFAAFACAPAGGGDTSGSGGSSGRPHADDRRPAVMTRQGSAPRANGGRVRGTGLGGRRS